MQQLAIRMGLVLQRCCTTVSIATPLHSNSVHRENYSMGAIAFCLTKTNPNTHDKTLLPTTSDRIHNFDVLLWIHSRSVIENETANTTCKHAELSTNTTHDLLTLQQQQLFLALRGLTVRILDGLFLFLQSFTKCPRQHQQSHLANQPPGNTPTHLDDHLHEQDLRLQRVLPLPPRPNLRPPPP